MCALNLYAVTNVTSIYKILNVHAHLIRDDYSVVVVSFNIVLLLKLIMAVTNVTSRNRYLFSFSYKLYIQIF